MDPVINAIHTLCSPEGLFIFFVGTSIGFIIGILPALGQGAALILAMPFAFYLKPMSAFILFAALLGSTTEGGSVTSILLNTPGTVGNLTTMFDGYPMARRGEAARALGIAGGSALFGGTFGVIVLILFIPIVQPLMYLFGAPEYFWSVVLALVIISIATMGGAVFKALISGGFGILLSLIGFNKITGLTRYAGDSLYLWDGIHIVVLVVGLFALSELIMLLAEGTTIESSGTARASRSSIRESIAGACEAFRSWPKLIRSSIIGTIVGIIPGIGSETATYVSYSTGKMLSTDKTPFGKGNPIGIMVSEAASNAKDGGALIPTLFLGIPGAAEMAILLGAFIILGIQPGPGMAVEHMDLIWAIIMSITLSSTLAGVLVILGAPLLSRITRISISLLVSVTVPLSLASVYATRGNAWDYVAIALFTIIGIMMKRGGYPLQPLIIGYVLGPLGEKAFFTALLTSYYNPFGFVKSPLSITLAALVGVLILGPILRNVWRSSAFLNIFSSAPNSESKMSSSKTSEQTFSYDSVLMGAVLAIMSLFFLTLAPSLDFPGLLFPLIFAGFLILLALIVIPSEIFPGFFHMVNPFLGPYLMKGEQRLEVRIEKLIPILGWVFVLIGLTVAIGTAVANLLFIFGLLWRMSQMKWHKAALCSAIISAGIYVLFTVLFEVPFWKGLIPEIIPNLLGGDILPPF